VGVGGGGACGACGALVGWVLPHPAAVTINTARNTPITGRLKFV
jgi:hypothetical protein